MRNNYHCTMGAWLDPPSPNQYRTQPQVTWTVRVETTKLSVEQLRTICNFGDWAYVSNVSQGTREVEITLTGSEQAKNYMLEHLSVLQMQLKAPTTLSIVAIEPAAWTKC